MTWRETLNRMASTLDEFRALIDREVSRSDVDLEVVLDAYTRCHRDLARDVRRLADEQSYVDQQILSQAATSIEKFLVAQLGDVVPNKYLALGDPGRTRSVLFAHLLKNVGRPVSADKLRAIAGDQTHTERRVRELRDYGFRVRSEVRSGETCYVLLSECPDTESVAWSTVRRRLKSDKALPSEVRDSLEFVIREREAEYGVRDSGGAQGGPDQQIADDCEEDEVSK